MQTVQKSVELKKKLIKFSIIQVIIVIVIIVIFILISNFQEKQESEINNVVSEIYNSNNQIDVINKKIDDAAKAKILWSKINQNHTKRQGLEIDKAKTILDDLKKLYYLPKDLIVDLSTPIELGDIYKTDTIVIVSSIVNISFSAMNDSLVYQFIDSISKNFPGFVLFKQFSINKQLDVNDEVIKNIADSKSQGLVNVTITFEWRDFKDIEKQNSKKP